MLTTFLRIIKYGFLGFWRNGWLSTVTTIIMLLALLVFEGLIITNIVANTAISSLENKLDISVYFKSETPEDEILRLKKLLEELAETKSVEYISKNEALAIFKEKHQDDSTISAALDELKNNPLLASLNIKANETKNYAVINAYLNQDSFKNYIDLAPYSSDQGLIIERSIKISDTLKKLGLISTIIFASIAVLITFNTIRLAIYANREEISIMRLVGASNIFTRGPYIVEGIIYGIIAGFLSFAVMVLIIYGTSRYVKTFIPEMNLWQYLLSNSIELIGYQLLFGVGLGAFSSFIAVRKYLKI
ncbi:MAG: permease-like cell division protein FtsX [Patescibacteria group bacterium]